MKHGTRIGLAALLVCVVTPGLFADTVTLFSFENVRTGLTPFTKTVDGLRASFSSDGDPDGFIVGFFPILNPTGLSLVEQCNFCFLTLTIDFSAPQSTFLAAFGTTVPRDTSSAPPFDLTAFSGASEVGSATTTGAVVPGLPLALGVLNFSGPAFDSVVLAAPTAEGFWILDGVTVIATPTVPEPSSLSLVAFVGFVGFCVIAITRLRRRGIIISRLLSYLHVPEDHQ
jgi:hypothetical protein